MANSTTQAAILNSGIALKVLYLQSVQQTIGLQALRVADFNFLDKIDDAFVFLAERVTDPPGYGSAPDTGSKPDGGVGIADRGPPAPPVIGALSENEIEARKPATAPRPPLPAGFEYDDEGGVVDSRGNVQADEVTQVRAVRIGKPIDDTYGSPIAGSPEPSEPAIGEPSEPDSGKLDEEVRKNAPV